jgi:hypothetical protein
MLNSSENSKRPIASITSTLFSPGPLPVYSVLKVSLDLIGDAAVDVQAHAVDAEAADAGIARRYHARAVDTGGVAGIKIGLHADADGDRRDAISAAAVLICAASTAQLRAAASAAPRAARMHRCLGSMSSSFKF